IIERAIGVEDTGGNVGKRGQGGLLNFALYSAAWSGLRVFSSPALAGEAGWGCFHALDESVSTYPHRGLRPHLPRKGKRGGGKGGPLGRAPFLSPLSLRPTGISPGFWPPSRPLSVLRLSGLGGRSLSAGTGGAATSTARSSLTAGGLHMGASPPGACH